ncbi:MAG: methylated-DNA--[protein]-cysteine S-methyltransferase [Endozoicomonadaceae bacterium]|nr:methylated-DNA--[protein]-cysteine S-methyltransferase [Endozoicomonadaceae bacterium]
MNRHQKIWLVVSKIPFGKVATYGQIAELAGLPRQARAVGSILSQLPRSSDLPWHRVINRKGKLSISPESGKYMKQKARLEQESITFDIGVESASAGNTRKHVTILLTF